MNKLLEQFRLTPTLGLAKKIIDYRRKHSMSDLNEEDCKTYDQAWQLITGE